MKYMGSKNRHSKEIIEQMKDKLKTCSAYVEPFVGGANIIDKIEHEIRIGSDIDSDLICLWNAVSEGWSPPLAITELEYLELKKQKDASPLKGYAAFALSYGGKKFGGWRRDSLNKRDYRREAYDNAIKQFPKLIGIKFYNCSYSELAIPLNSVIYCDPPYKGTTKYSNSFDSGKFFDWVRLNSLDNYIYVSEYSAPSDFTCIWSKSVNSSLTANTGSKTNIEKLFVYNGGKK